MFKKLLFLFSALLVITSTGYAKEVADIDVPDSILAGSDVLVLNGAGIRTKLFIKAYVGGLYLKQKNGDAVAIINADEIVPVDMVVLMAPLVPARGTRDLAQVMGVGVDPLGFLEEMNARSDATRSNVRGILYRRHLPVADEHARRDDPGRGGLWERPGCRGRGQETADRGRDGVR